MLLSALLAATAPVAPSGPWNVEAAQSYCLLSRHYGDAQNPTLVSFQPVFSRATLKIILITPNLKIGSQSGEATLTRSPDGRSFKGRFFTITLKDGRTFTRISVDQNLFEGLDSTDTLTISAGKIDQTIAIVRAGKALAAYKQCERDLLSSWGVDSDALAGGRGPIPNGPMTRYFRPQDYPTGAITKGQIGDVAAVLTVDATGKVSGCRPVAGASPPLNAVTCRRAMTIPFDPGVDKAGKPIASIFIMNVRWSMAGGQDGDSSIPDAGPGLSPLPYLPETVQ